MKDRETKNGQSLLHQLGALAALLALVTLVGYAASALGNGANAQMQTSLLVGYGGSSGMDYDESSATEEVDTTDNETTNEAENKDADKTLCEDGKAPVAGQCAQMKEDREHNVYTQQKPDVYKEESYQYRTDQKVDHCGLLKEKAAGGDEAARQEFEKYCAYRRDNHCSRLKEMMDAGEEKAASEYKEYCSPKDEDHEPVHHFCKKLKMLLEEGTYTAKEKESYKALCVKERPLVNACENLKRKLEMTDDKSTVESNEDFIKLCTYQPSYKEESSFCEEMKTMMEKYSSDTANQDYSLAKQKYVAYCEKQVPPAGYEDEVIAEYEEEDNPFSDTETCSLGGRSAFELYRRAVIGGFEDGTFRGDNPVNRAEAAKFLLLARFGSVEDTDNSGRFRDVSGKPWFIRYIMRAAELGIIGGHPDGTFKPADGVSVAEFLKMLALTFDLEPNLPHSYGDVPADAWFAKYAGIATKYKLFPKDLDDCVEGVGDSAFRGEDEDFTGEDEDFDATLNPSHKLTRYEVAVAIYQFLVNRGSVELQDNSSQTEPQDNMSQ